MEACTAEASSHISTPSFDFTVTKWEGGMTPIHRNRSCIEALETKTCFTLSRLGEQIDFVLAKALVTVFNIGRSKM